MDMKINTNIKKLSVYPLIIALIAGSIIFSLSMTIVFSAPGDRPSIIVDTPAEGQWIQDQNVKAAGSYIDENVSIESDLRFTAYKKLDETSPLQAISNSVDQPGEWAIGAPDETHKGTWAFTKQMEKGSYSLVFEVEELTDPKLKGQASIGFYVGVQPAVWIATPHENEWIPGLDASMVGNYQDKNIANSSEIVFSAFEQNPTTKENTLISNSTVNPGDWGISGPDLSGNGTWSFKKPLNEGPHKIVIEIKEPQTSFVNSAMVSFTLGDRPYIADSKIVFPDSVEYTAEDLTSVPTTDVKLKITINDNKALTKLKSDIESKNYNPVKVYLGSNTIPWNIDRTESVMGTSTTVLVLKPAEALWPNSTYMVYIDQAMTDDDNFNVFPKSFSFTTKSYASGENNPHGNYANPDDPSPQDRTYLCGNCHSTHEAINSSLEIGAYSDLKVDPAENYCMSCHDGTTNAPAANNMDKQHRHVISADTDLKHTGSCTSCHDPHQGWSGNNPNKLTVRSTFTSTEDPNDTVNNIDDNVSDPPGYELTSQEVLSYKKAFSADGQLENYALCLRCHNASKKAQNPVMEDIESYYKQSNSRHFLGLPSGKTANLDGSQLNGPLPCADCHETHGSNNLKILRGELGNIRITDDANKFVSSGTEWNAANERSFCLKCHNGSTEVYGRAGSIPDSSKSEGHDPATAKGKQACSTCHSSSYDPADPTGTISRALLEGAHSPKAGVEK